MEMGANSVADSFTIHKKTITGHETAYGCTIGNVTIRGGLDDFVIVTITGMCKGVSKMQAGLTVANLTAGNQNFTADDQVKGRVGLGNFIAFMEGTDRHPTTGGRLVTAFDPATRIGTYSGANLGAVTTPSIVSALGDPAYTDYQENSIFGDGSLLSVDGGANERRGYGLGDQPCNGRECLQPLRCVSLACRPLPTQSARNRQHRHGRGRR